VPNQALPTMQFVLFILIRTSQVRDISTTLFSHECLTSPSFTRHSSLLMFLLVALLLPQNDQHGMAVTMIISTSSSSVAPRFA
jgi:hypothetical protein